MEKVAIYCRLSDEDRNKQNSCDESESIQNQKTLLTKYAIEKGWTIYRIYVDDDYSGLDHDRPAFSQMIQDAEAKRFNIVLCKHQSRFTRDMELVEKYLHNKFIEWDIRFVSMIDNVDTKDKGNKKSRQVFGLVNEWYSEDISEAIKATFKIKKEEGKFIGSFAPYGYVKDPKDKNKLIIDETASKVVEMIFEWFLQGYGTQRICNMLNEKRIPNPTTYKQSLGLNYQNSSNINEYGLWNKTTIKRILGNQTYIGHMVQGKREKVNYKSKKVLNHPKSKWTIVENTHDPIIEQSIFFKAQEKLSGRGRSGGDGKRHILSTKVKCMDCHSSLSKVKAGQYVYLRCSLYARDPKKELCSSHSIRLDQLLHALTQKLRGHIKLINLNNLVHRIQQETDIQQRAKQLEKALMKINQKVNEKSNLLKNLYIDKVAGVITEDQFYDYNNNFIAEKEVLLKERKALNQEINMLAPGINDTERWRAIFNKYTDLNELDHLMVSELIDYVEIGQKDTKAGEQKIKIHWLF